MEALEYFNVESPEPIGAEYYQQIVAVVLQDLNLIKIISKLHVYVDPKVPIFIAVGLIKKLPALIRVRDCGNVKIEDNKAIISISNETYLAPLLTALYQKFGKDRVDQPDRFTIIISSDKEFGPQFEEIIIADPSEGIYRDIIYAMQYAAPEGFKVRRQFVSKERFYYVASEDTLDNEAIDRLVKEKFSLLGVTL